MWKPAGYRANRAHSEEAAADSRKQDIQEPRALFYAEDAGDDLINKEEEQGLDSKNNFDRTVLSPSQPLEAWMPVRAPASAQVLVGAVSHHVGAHYDAGQKSTHDRCLKLAAAQLGFSEEGNLAQIMKREEVEKAEANRTLQLGNEEKTDRVRRQMDIIRGEVEFIKRVYEVGEKSWEQEMGN